MPVKRVPKKLKIIRGTQNVTKDIKNQMDMPELGQIPECPEELTKLSRGEAIWNDSTQDLFNLGMLHIADLQQLMAYCLEMCRYWDCQDKINQAGSTVYPMKDKDGNTVSLAPLPYITMAKKHIDTARAIAREFGFSPSARSGIAMPTRASGPVDPMKALMEKYK
jgi:P27 family predicted phage terminase small subunit